MIFRLEPEIHNDRGLRSAPNSGGGETCQVCLPPPRERVFMPKFWLRGSPLPVGAHRVLREGAGGEGRSAKAPRPGHPRRRRKNRAREAGPPQRVWRVVSTARRPRAPAWVVGKLVHECLHRWRFPAEVRRGFPDDVFENFLRPFAIELGLTDPAEIHAAVQESRRLLERFRVHPLYTEMDSAERHHEILYFLPVSRGVIDLIYRTETGWFLADFKTDEVRSDAEAQATIRENGYDRQVARYAEAVAAQLKTRAEPSRSVQAVFLNVKGEVKVY